MRLLPAILLLLSTVCFSAAVYEVHFNSHPYPGEWNLPDDFSHDASGGESGSGALCFKKRPGAPYVIASHAISLDHGSRYRLSMMIRCEKVMNLSGKGLFALEYKKNGEHITGNYYSLKQGDDLHDGNWHELVLEVAPPNDFDTATISFYLGRAVHGTVWYDNLRLEKIGAVPPDIFDLPPSNLTIRGTEAELAFRAVVYHPVDQTKMEMILTCGNRQMTAQADDSSTFRFLLNALTPGELTVNLALRLLPDGKTLGEASFRYFVNHSPAAANATWIDNQGYTFVHGKPSLPIGFYCRDISEEIMQRISAAGANCLMSYTIGQEENISEKLDLASRYNLKVLFNVMYQHDNAKSKITEYAGVQGTDAVLKAWVEEFRRHPALLGWYLSDENPRQELPRLRQMREMINAIDPDHFTVSLTYRPIDFPAFISTGDIFATDPYPIETDASRSMSKVKRLIEGASKLTPRVWMVPQAFNWGAFRQHENPEQPWRFPSENEIRSMVLAGAIYGAKGFLFYSYSSIFELGERRYPGSAEENWQRVIPTIKLLQELSPFLLSSEKPPEIAVSGINTDARVWMQGKKIKILIAGNGPGENEAILVVPGFNKLQSRFGLTENIGEHKYRFRAQDISSDILE